jgi:ketosteroid isomerase-like protein
LRPQLDPDSQATLEAVNRYNAAVNAHDLEGVMANMTEDRLFSNTRPAPSGTLYRGQAEVRAWWSEFFKNSPKANFAGEEVIVAGDRCIVRWHYTWEKEGKPGEIHGVDVLKVRDGKIAEKLAYVKG